MKREINVIITDATRVEQSTDNGELCRKAMESRAWHVQQAAGSRQQAGADATPAAARGKRPHS